MTQKLNDESEIAVSLGNLGDVACEEKDYEKARECYYESLKIAQEIGRVDLIANQKYGLGEVEEGHGNYPQAKGFFEEALELYQRLGVKKKIDICKQKLSL